MHTYDGNLCRLGHLGPARPHPGVAGVGAGVAEPDGDEREGAVPDVVGEGRDAGLLHRHSVLQPDELELVQRPRVDDALQLGHRLVLDDGHVLRRDDELGRHVDHVLAVNRQGDVGRVLLLADLSVGGAGSEKLYRFHLFSKSRKK